jgi:limonene-1,2-epoxide hydrolase
VGAHDTLFADIDSMVPAAFAAHLADGVRMRFGNADPVHGRAACEEAWAQFCGSVSGVAHAIRNRWPVGGATVVEAEVTYRRADGSEVTVPVVTVYEVGADELITDYRIYIDLAPLFAPG